MKLWCPEGIAALKARVKDGFTAIPLFLHKSTLGSCKWNSNLGYNVCNDRVLVRMSKCNNRAFSVQWKCAIMGQMKNELKLHQLIVDHKISHSNHICTLWKLGCYILLPRFINKCFLYQEEFCKTCSEMCDNRVSCRIGCTIKESNLSEYL
jgi:hypothetical protein